MAAALLVKTVTRFFNHKLRLPSELATPAAGYNSQLLFSACEQQSLAAAVVIFQFFCLFVTID